MNLPRPQPLLRRLAALAAVGGLVTAGWLSATTGPTTAAPATAAACTDAHQRIRPGTHAADPDQVSAATVAAAQTELAGKQRRMGSLARLKIVAPTSKITIKVYVHVITMKSRRDSSGNYYGWIPTKRITDQITVLNNAYASSGFAFALATTPPANPSAPWVTSIPNDSWYNWSETTDDGPAKRALHQGSTTTDLNLYFAQLADGVLGYSTFPWERQGLLDGVVLLNNSVPGGNAAGFNVGDTAVHEIGHWLGLLHTFQDGCSYVNDAVADTPAQYDGDNIYGCDTTDDTCPLPGTDPVRNYMSYGNDACLNSFTAGQGLRMRQTWYSYRAPVT